MRYAENEIYARHGFAFPPGPIRRQFERFAWYRPQTGLTKAEIVSSLEEIESGNLQVLIARREELERSGRTE